MVGQLDGGGERSARIHLHLPFNALDFGRERRRHLERRPPSARLRTWVASRAIIKLLCPLPSLLIYISRSLVRIQRLPRRRRRARWIRRVGWRRRRARANEEVAQWLYDQDEHNAEDLDEDRESQLNVQDLHLGLPHSRDLRIVQALGLDARAVDVVAEYGIRLDKDDQHREHYARSARRRRQRLQASKEVLRDVLLERHDAYDEREEGRKQVGHVEHARLLLWQGERDRLERGALARRVGVAEELIVHVEDKEDGERVERDLIRVDVVLDGQDGSGREAKRQEELVAPLLEEEEREAPESPRARRPSIGELAHLLDKGGADHHLAHSRRIHVVLHAKRHDEDNHEDHGHHHRFGVCERLVHRIARKHVGALDNGHHARALHRHASDACYPEEELLVARHVVVQANMRGRQVHVRQANLPLLVLGEELEVGPFLWRLRVDHFVFLAVWLDPIPIHPPPGLRGRLAPRQAARAQPSRRPSVLAPR